MLEADLGSTIFLYQIEFIVVSLRVIIFDYAVIIFSSNRRPRSGTQSASTVV